MVAKAGAALREVWPVAGIVLAMVVTLVWISALGYGMFKLFAH